MNQTWGCQYVIVEFARREFRMLDMSNLSGYAWGAFATRQKAEAAALVKAKALIDKFRFTDDL